MPNACNAVVVWCQAQLLNRWYVLPVKQTDTWQTISIKGEMFMFICADSVLVHRPSSDSLMTSCSHITIPHSERQQKHRMEEEEEGGSKTILRQDILNHTITLRTHWRAACKSISWQSYRAKVFWQPTVDSGRAEESHFLHVWLCVYEKQEGGLCLLPMMRASSCVSPSAALYHQALRKKTLIIESN